MDTSIQFPNLGITIDPSDGFSIGSFEIKWYGVIIALGVLLATLYVMRRVKEFGITQDDVLNLLLICLPSAIVGARLYYVIFKWDQFFGEGIPWYRFLDIRGGGLAIYGGIIGAALGMLIYSLIKKRRITPYLDVMGLGLLIGQCMGRWGNFFNREAFGSYTNNLFAMRISDVYGRGIDQTALQFLAQKAQEGGYAGYIQVHPTFLYESVWNLIGFVILHFVSKKRKYDGQVFLGYLAWYGLGRMLIEGLRTDSLYIGPLRASQWLAGITLLTAVAILIYQKFFVRRKPEDLLVNCVAATMPAQEETSEEATDGKEND